MTTKNEQYQSFYDKADWEGGIMEVASQWPDMVPPEVRSEAEAAVEAIELFERVLRAEAAKHGVVY